MIIPPERLSAEALQQLIEQFVLREGTEYGAQEVSLADKVAQVAQQLEQGQVVIIYSQLHETIDIVPSDSVARESEQGRC